MQPRYRFYFKTTETNWVFLNDEPQGWDDITEEIIRDYTLHGLLVNTKATLKFTGDGYDYVKNIYDCSSFCSEIKIKIEELCSEDGNYETYFIGLIKMGDVKFFLNECICEAPLVDNSYYARIKNNAKIEAAPHVGKSKNGEDITAASMSIVFMFNPVTGGYSATPRKAYRWFEIIKFLISFVSDGEMQFASDILDTGDFSGEFLTTGSHLKDGNISNYQNPDIGMLSLETALNELYKIANTGFTIEYNGDIPVFRLEGADYFYNSTVVDTLENVSGAVKKIKTDQLYAFVNFGSSTIIKQADVPALSYPSETPVLSYNDEKFHLTGQCNTETSLDIKGDFIRDTNVIEDILNGVTAFPNDAYDENFIFISAEPNLGNYRAVQYDIRNIGTPPAQYNGNITNYEIALRFFGYIPNDLVRYFITGSHSFEAIDPAICNNITQIIADVDVLIPCSAVISNDGDYIPANYEYVAPSNGTFSFGGLIYFDWFSNGTNGISTSSLASGVFKVFNAANVFQREYIFGNTIWDNTINHSNLWDVQGTYAIPLSATEKVRMYLRLQLNSASYNKYALNVECPIAFYHQDRRSVFSCNANGAEVPSGNPEDFKAELFSFEYPISNSRWKTIKLNPIQILQFNTDGVNNYLPWIDRITYNKKTSMANCSLIGKSKKTC